MGKIDLMNFPEELLYSQILTRLPLKEAVRFSAVSKKWCKAWTQLPHLKFSDEFFNSIKTCQNMPEDIINKIISMQYTALETFELYNCDWYGSSIHKWLHWVSLLDVKCINLACQIPMEVSESLFSCATLTSLSLKNFKMTRVPAPFQGFSQLVACYLKCVRLSEKAFEVILKCYHLQSLTFESCRLPSNFRIISSSLTSLALLKLYDGLYSMEANCPRLESIKLIGCHGFAKVNLCLPVCVHLEVDFAQLKHFATVKSLRKITCFDDAIISCVKVLESFPRLEELCIENWLFASYPNDVAGLTLRLANLKTFILNIGDIFYTSYAEKYNIDEKYAPEHLCSCVLEGSPMLRTVRIGLDYRAVACGTDEFDRALQILNVFYNLARGFPKTQISLSSVASRDR